MQYLQKLRRNTWLPYFMPNVWYMILGTVLAVSMIAGAWIWIYTLQLRGLW